MTAFEERLRELQQLRTNDTITQDEYTSRREAILDQLSHIDASKKGLNALQRVYLTLGIVALVAIVLFVAFFVFSLVVGVFGGATTEAGSTSPYQAPASSDVANGAHAARVDISRIDDPATATGAPTGKRYIAVQTTVSNVGHRGLSGDFRLRTWDGHEYAPKIVPDLGATDLTFLKNLPVGETRQGTIAFEVPETAQVQWLRYRSGSAGIQMLFGEEN